MEEVGPDKEYILLRAERQGDIPTRRSSANRGKEMGRQAGVLGTPHSSLDQVEGSRRGVGDPRLGRLDRGGLYSPLYPLDSGEP